MTTHEQAIDAVAGKLQSNVEVVRFVVESYLAALNAVVMPRELDESLYSLPAQVSETDFLGWINHTGAVLQEPEHE